MVPVVTLKVLDLVPDRRGMASSLQAFIGSVANGFVAGVIAPLVMHSTHALAVASALMMLIGVGRVDLGQAARGVIGAADVRPRSRSATRASRRERIAVSRRSRRGSRRANKNAARIARAAS